MSAMRHDLKKTFHLLRNQQGIGLVAAVFVIVVLGLFGTLLARYTATGSRAAAEDYVWAQALYAAESAARLRILNHDGGGNWAGFAFPAINNCQTASDLDSFAGPGTPARLRVRASRADIVREIEVNFIL